jgi:hypothetical protein
MQLIDKAIELLQDEGWIRGASHTSMGYCLSGALTDGWILTGQSEKEFHWALRAVMYEVARPGLTYWNDHIARDRDHVLEVLKLAGERVDLEGERRAANR